MGDFQTVARPQTLENTSIEIIHETERAKVQHALFDFDGTISLIRDGWQSVMVPMMVDILLEETQTDETPEELERIVVEFVDRLTGKQTIYQMIQLCEEIEKRGGVPKPPLEYKDLYNNLLLPTVDKRIAKLERGEIEAPDLRVPMSLEFLQCLQKRSIKRSLASGTDVEFVRHEAGLLGVASYFDGGIFGALREYQNFSKAMVIQQILDDFNLTGGELLVVGDGSVEIENAKAVGAIAVGVTSVENNRYQMNADKRGRLLRAGADILIPDFRDGARLLTYLFDRGQ